MLCIWHLRALHSIHGLIAEAQDGKPNVDNNSLQSHLSKHNMAAKPVSTPAAASKLASRGNSQEEPSCRSVGHAPLCKASKDQLVTRRNTKRLHQPLHPHLHSWDSWEILWDGARSISECKTKMHGKLLYTCTVWFLYYFLLWNHITIFYKNYSRKREM